MMTPLLSCAMRAHRGACAGRALPLLAVVLVFWVSPAGGAIVGGAGLSAQAEALRARGRALFRAEEARPAARAFRAALRAEPPPWLRSSLLSDLSVALTSLGDDAGARRAAKRALRAHFPPRDAVLSNYAELCASPAERATALRALALRRPGDVNATRSAASALQAAGEDGEAADLLESVLLVAPRAAVSPSEALAAAGVALLRAGNCSRALQRLTAAANAAPRGSSERAVHTKTLCVAYTADACRAAASAPIARSSGAQADSGRSGNPLEAGNAEGERCLGVLLRSPEGGSMSAAQKGDTWAVLGALRMRLGDASGALGAYAAARLAGGKVPVLLRLEGLALAHCGRDSAARRALLAASDGAERTVAAFGGQFADLTSAPEAAGSPARPTGGTYGWSSARGRILGGGMPLAAADYPEGETSGRGLLFDDLEPRVVSLPSVVVARTAAGNMEIASGGRILRSHRRLYGTTYSQEEAAALAFAARLSGNNSDGTRPPEGVHLERPPQPRPNVGDGDPPDFVVPRVFANGNFFHFLTETLASVLVASRPAAGDGDGCSAGRVLLVASEFGETRHQFLNLLPNFRRGCLVVAGDATRLQAGHDQAVVVPLPERALARIAAWSLSSAPVRPEPMAAYYAPRVILMRLRDALRESVQPPPAADMLVYARRGSTSQRCVSPALDAALEAALRSAAARSGLRFVVHDDGATAAEQVSPFARAAAVVGPHGAALALATACAPGTLLVELPVLPLRSNYFAAMAAALGLNYRLFPNIASRTHGPFRAANRTAHFADPACDDGASLEAAAASLADEVVAAIRSSADEHSSRVTA